MHLKAGAGSEGKIKGPNVGDLREGKEKVCWRGSMRRDYGQKLEFGTEY